MKKLCNIILLASLSLTGCSFLSPVNIESQTNYLLNTIPKNIPHKRTRPITLLVLPPDTRPIYNTRQMAYTVKPYEVSYFSQNQWAETPSQMFQSLLTETLEHTHYFKTVVTTPYSGPYQYALSTQILEIRQDYTNYPKVCITLNVKIIDARTSAVIAIKQFSVSIPITQKSPYAGVIAANKASARILSEVAKFSINNIH